MIKSGIDKRNYKHIVLPNEMNVLLIQDKEITTTTVALNVNVGYYCDPDEYPGVAHF